MAQPAPEGGTSRINTTVFDCTPIGAEAFEFTIRRGPGELALWLPLELNRPYLVLSQLPDAERDEYREGDVVVRLRAEGREADLTVGDTSFPGCRANAVRSLWEHAKLSGVDFRATGTNPDWSVEIRRGGQLVFRSESQTAPVSVATPEPETDDVRGYGIYRAATPDGDLTVTIGGGPCSAPDRANLTGSLVTVRVGAEIVSGCGRPLH